jgi:mannose-6-phosphate isomerase
VAEGATHRPQQEDAPRARTGPTAPRAGATPRTPGSTLLAANQLERFYRGGERISQLRGRSSANGGGPEDWVGSTTTALGAGSEGLSRLPDGRFLRDAIEADPVAFLGPEHVARWGANPALLVKLLDAGERLPVHFHPGRRFARDALGLRFGKTEAWIVVAADPDAVVYIGFKTALQREALAQWLEEQDTEAMLAAMNELPVRAGTALLVPAGTVHSIGTGILLVELQEPTDLSVLLEWQRFGVGDGAAHLGLGWERALDAVDLTPGPVPGLSGQNGSPTSSDAVTDLLPVAADPYFRAQRISTEGERVELEPSFAILVVLDGVLTLSSERGQPLALHRGDTALVPHAAGATTIQGSATVIRCRPPDPSAGAGRW